MFKKFALGRVVMTRGVEGSFTHEECFSSLARHENGDFGDICDEDREVNIESSQSNGGIMSAYKFEGDRTLWIITEADRSVTTLLLPDEY